MVRVAGKGLGEVVEVAAVEAEVERKQKPAEGEEEGLEESEEEVVEVEAVV